MNNLPHTSSSRWTRHLWLVLILLAGVLLGASVLVKRGTDISYLATRQLSRRIAERMTRLEAAMEEVLALPPTVWPEMPDLPEDMVIYRYDNDSLTVWCHRFPLANDDLTRRFRVERFVARRSHLVSPLQDVDTVVGYHNIGPQWFLAKRMDDGRGRTVIGGLMVRNSLDTRSFNGVNPRLRVSSRFSVYPVSASGGATILVEGVPLLKIIQENTRVVPLIPSAGILWLALALVLTGIFLHLARGRTLPRAGIAVAVVTAVMAVIYLLGRSMQGMSDVFSPTVYAGGPFLFSLGAVLIVNTYLTCLAVCLSMVQFPVLRRLRRDGRRWPSTLYAAFLCLAIAGLVVYIHRTFSSIIANSDITLELYKIRDLSRFTAYVYLSFLLLLACIPLLLQLLSPLVRRATGFRCNMFSRTGRVAFALLAAAYLLATASVLGFRREESRAEIWANRLAVDRNLGFEVRLRRVERAIASDPVIPALLAVDTDYRITLGRISENYIHRLGQDYDVSMYMFREEDSDPGTLRYYNDRLRVGTALPDSSRFFYSRSGNGRACYTGVFTYFTPSTGVTTLLIGLDSKAEKAGRGYAAALGSPGDGVLPRGYSYGKYLEDKLISYRGDYAYPTVLSGRLQEVALSAEDTREVALDHYVHFVTPVSDDECIVISRPATQLTQYLVAGMVLFLLAFFGINVTLVFRRRSRRSPARNYYKQRINIVLFSSLVATLVAMASISVLFVYRRNEANLQSLMTGRINTIQSLVEARTRGFSGSADFLTQEFGGILASIGDYTRSDITLYAADGKVLRSTAPDYFERMVLASRMDEDAFCNIMFRNRRYFIHKETVSGHTYYAMYAPVFASDGRMLSVACAPYTDSGLEFREEAVFHAVFIVTVFFLLLILTRFFSTKVVDRMFRPLVEMGEKMSAARPDDLEYIFYEREDELSGLVRSYNLMVHNVSESTKQLAQVERDKAWSEMARQVAHEIKNPLTPIKLQIQRIIRLRERGDASWEEKFVSIVPVVMDSIDNLTDTANEFSTFAKLYSEEPVEIDLDALLADQVALFDDKAGVSFQYIGLKGAVIHGPKPQLTRVFVNLLSNAVQAVRGTGSDSGRIWVSLRNATREGFYDIVFEDNGPGVPDENRARLFTPNFTTKTGGTGLGLAICKNILERCGGEIFYSRSFALGGAAFTVCYPKG